MQFDVAIYTPRGLYRQTKASIINVITPEGQRGILPNHAAIVATLTASEMTMDEDGVRQTYAVGGGTIFFRNNQCTILTHSIENANDIDIDRALRAKERAEQRLESFDEAIDRDRARRALERANNRIRMKRGTH